MKNIFKIIGFLYLLFSPLQTIFINNLSEPVTYLKNQILFIILLLITEFIIFKYKKFIENSNFWTIIEFLITFSLFIISILFIKYSVYYYTLWTILLYVYLRILYSYYSQPALGVIVLSLIVYVNFCLLGLNNILAQVISLMFASLAYPLIFQHKDINNFIKLIYFLPAIIGNFLISLNFISPYFLVLNLSFIHFSAIKVKNDKSFNVFYGLIVLIMIIIGLIFTL